MSNNSSLGYLYQIKYLNVYHKPPFYVSLIESNAKRMMYKEIQQNALCHNQPHKLKRVLKSKLNSAERFLKLSVSLLLALDRSRPISKLKIKYCITFLSCNWLTRTESSIRWRRICPGFLSLNSQNWWNLLDWVFYYAVLELSKNKFVVKSVLFKNDSIKPLC